jgi:hypothetical protein
MILFFILEALGWCMIIFGSNGTNEKSAKFKAI